MKNYLYPKQEDWTAILQRPTFDLSDIEPIVNDVLQQIKSEGDDAIKRFTLKFDKVQVDDTEVKEE